jgi:hypothetical protein
MDLVYLHRNFLLLVFDFRTIGIFIITNSSDFFILGSLSFHVIAFRSTSQNAHKNIILFTYKYYIAF